MSRHHVRAVSSRTSFSRASFFRTSAAACVLVVLAMVASCSSGGGGGGTADPADDKTGTISFMTWASGASVDAATKKIAKLYTDTHPGTKINVTILPYDQYAQKIQLTAAGGSTPDIFQAPASALKFVQSGRVVRIEDYLRDDPVLNDPAKARTWAYSLAKIDGEHIDAFPLGGLCGMQLYFNRELFDKANVDYPDESWTWDDFRAAAAKLTVREGGKTVQWGTDLGYLAGWDGGWQSVAASNGMKTFMTRSDGKAHLELDQPPVVETWQFMQDLVFKDKVAPPPATAQALAQGGGTAFQSGRVAMVPDGCWQMGPYQTSVEQLGMTTLPRGTTGKSVGPVWGTNMFIAKSSKHPGLAYDFLRWWTVEKAAIEPYAKASGWCGTSIVKEHDNVVSTAWKEIPGGEACVKSLDGAQVFSIISPNWDQAYTNVLAPLWNDKFLQGKMSATELSAELLTSLNAAL
jgi:multiple sugar transport system substrate-binding protein